MIWKKDKLKPSQPYFVLDTDNFYQEVYLKQGISHFYAYSTKGSRIIRAVPDGCIDIFLNTTAGRCAALPPERRWPTGKS